MNHFHVCDKIKSIFLVTLSVVILVCSVPFSSHAAGIGTLPFPIDDFTFNAFNAYLLTKGYSAPALSGEDSVISYHSQTNMAQEIFYSFLNKIQAFNAVTYGHLIQSFREATTTGVLTISEEDDAVIDEYLTQETALNQIAIADRVHIFEAVKAGTTFTYSTMVYRKDYPSILYPFTWTVTCDFDCLPIASYSQTYPQSGFEFRFIPLTKIDNSVSATTKVHFNMVGDNTSNLVYTEFGASSYGNDLGYVPYVGFRPTNWLQIFLSQSSYSESIYVEDASDVAVLSSIILPFRRDGYLETTDSYISQQVYDTSGSTVLSPASSVNASTGAIAGGLTIYLPLLDRLEGIIEAFSNGVISYQTAIKQLGLSIVSDGATVQEKEDALADVAYPDSTYDWITSTAWGAQALTQTTESLTDSKAEEDSIADSVSETLTNGDNSEDDNEKKRGKGLIAALLIALGLWNTPIIAGDPEEDSDSGGTDDGSGSGSNPGYLAETIAGMTVAGSLMDDFFSSAGGSDGYGFIYTVGASFVIFSVVIGAANYFGALFHGSDTKQNIKPSGKQSKAQTVTSKKG